MNRRLSYLAGAAFLIALGLGPAPDAGAQASPQPCTTCDQLNSRGPGAGGPGFFQFDYFCTTLGGEVTANVTTQGRPGTFIAGFGAKGHVVETPFVGTTTVVATGISQGTVVTRYIKNPDGTYAVTPRDQVFECGDCEQPPTSSPPTTTPPGGSVTTIPGPATSIPRTSVKAAPLPSGPGVTSTLPATGGDSGNVVFLGISLLGVAVFLIYISRRRLSAVEDET